METNASVRSDVRRYASLLAEGLSPRPVYDEVLLETHGCVVTPTLGSILANWLLVIPRAATINFARWQAVREAQPYDLIQAILAKHGVADDRVIWFEHGPAEAGTSVGCGVDQAHLHVIVDSPFSFQDFVTAAMGASHLKWQQKSAWKVHQSGILGVSYLIAGSKDLAVVARNVESVGSQFFRRIIAGLVRQPDAWNYRTHPYLDNVRKTLQAFSTQLT